MNSSPRRVPRGAGASPRRRAAAPCTGCARWCGRRDRPPPGPPGGPRRRTAAEVRRGYDEMLGAVQQADGMGGEGGVVAAGLGLTPPEGHQVGHTGARRGSTVMSSPCRRTGRAEPAVSGGPLVQGTGQGLSDGLGTRGEGQFRRRRPPPPHLAHPVPLPDQAVVRGRVGRSRTTGAGRPAGAAGILLWPRAGPAPSRRSRRRSSPRAHRPGRRPRPPGAAGRGRPCAVRVTLPWKRTCPSTDAATWQEPGRDAARASTSDTVRIRAASSVSRGR